MKNITLLGLVVFTFSFSSSAHAKLDDSEFKSITEVNAPPSQAPAQPENAAKQWFEKMDLSGFLAADYIKSGADRTDQVGSHFYLDGLELEFEMNPWKNTSVVAELYPSFVIPYDGSGFFLGSAYAQFKNVLNSDGENLLNIKIGRMDLPYGEEYLWQYPVDNPLITRGAAWWWTFTEGAEIYGNVGKLKWITSASTGGSDDSKTKDLSVKLYGDLTDQLYASASYLYIDPAQKGGIIQGARSLKAEGNFISGNLYELDLKYTFGKWGYISVEAGQAFIANHGPDFKRTLNYGLIEPLVNITDKFYGVFRYSAIGTYKSAEGYTLSDGYDMNGIADAKSISRSAVGLGYRLNPNTTLKVEYSVDKVAQIDNPSALVGNDRNFFGLEAAVKF